MTINIVRGDVGWGETRIKNVTYTLAPNAGVKVVIRKRRFSWWFSPYYGTDEVVEIFYSDGRLHQTFVWGRWIKKWKTSGTDLSTDYAVSE